jgi:hypothetical protein
MTVKAPVDDDRPSASTEFRRSSERRARVEALEQSDIAELSATAIDKMTSDELVRMIRVANLPGLLCPDLDEHLPFYEHAVLTRLAHLARRCCRNQRPGSFATDAE